MHDSPVLSISPSFSSYSDPKLAGVAARIVHELASERRENSAGISGNRDPESDKTAGDSDFDVAFATRNPESSSQIPADEIFEDGRIRPIYPVKSRNADPERPRTRKPLGKLFIKERETEMATSSSSSSEADDIDTNGVVTTALHEERRWKKYAAAGGNSTIWNLKSLMSRSQSERGKDSVVVLTHCASEDEKKARETPVVGGKVRPPPASNRDCGERLRSYLPYRLDLVGFFGSINLMGKNSKQY